MAALPGIVVPGPTLFRREGHEIEYVPIYGDQEMQLGEDRRRRLYLTAPRIVTVSLDRNQAGAEEFAAWFNGPLRGGDEYFSAQVQNQGPGTRWWKAKFLGPKATYSAQYMGGGLWVISMKLILFGSGYVSGPASTALVGNVGFALTGTSTATATQPLSGGVGFALVPVAAAAAGFLAGGVGFALLLGTYVAPAVGVGAAAGTSIGSGVGRTLSAGNAAGTSTASAFQPGFSIGSAAGAATVNGVPLLPANSYPDVGATWVTPTGALAIPINVVPIYFKRARSIVGVSITTLGGNGSCVIDIWKRAMASYPPSVADTICAASKPTIIAGTHFTDFVLSGWNTSISAGDVLFFNLDSTSAFSLIAVRLHLSE